MGDISWGFKSWADSAKVESSRLRSMCPRLPPSVEEEHFENRRAKASKASPCFNFFCKSSASY